MNINKEEIQSFLGKKIRAISKSEDSGRTFTYVGELLSFGDTYIKLRDKYDVMRIISTEFLILLEEVRG